MPAVSQRSSSRRRTVSEINMVPFIDVMLVLLIIFMVSAPLITTGVIDLPTVGRSKQMPQHLVELMVGSDEQVKLRIDKVDAGAVSLREVANRVKSAQKGDPNTPVVISGDRTVKYEVIVKLMDTLQKAGVQRVGLSVKSGG